MERNASRSESCLTSLGIETIQAAFSCRAKSTISAAWSHLGDIPQRSLVNPFFRLIKIGDNELKLTRGVLDDVIHNVELK